MRGSVRIQLTIAMVAIAVIATLISTFVANHSLHDHLNAMSQTTAPVDAHAERVEVARELDRQHAIAGVIAVGFALVSALLLGRYLTSPLTRLAGAADRLADGDLATKIPNQGPHEIRRISEAFERVRQGLAQEDRLRRLGFAELAHELRTPVTNIRARLEAAQDDVMPIEQSLPVMQSEVERLGHLLDQLSLLVDLENPTARYEMVPVEVGVLVQRQADLAQARIEHAELNMLVDIEEGVWTLGEPHKLEQVVCNLVANAVAYSTPSGTITVAVGGRDDLAVLTVSDQGIGIDATELPFVTRRFWRGAAARGHAGNGSGVGLALVDEVVRAHTGCLRIDSKPGCGTTVTVELPLYSSN